MKNYEWPTGAIDTPCVVALIPTGIVPFVAGALDRWLQVSTWSSRGDYEQAYNAIAEVLSCMPSLCVQQLVESNDRLYRLLDSTLNGVEYEAVEIDEVVSLLPAIPVVPAPVSRSIHSRLERLEYLQDNAFNGAVHAPDFLDTSGLRQKLDAILTALSDGSPLDADMLAALGEIVAALA